MKFPLLQLSSNGKALLRIKRLACVSGAGNMKKAAARRAAARFNHHKRRIAMETYDGYNAAPSFLQPFPISFFPRRSVVLLHVKRLRAHEL